MRTIYDTILWLKSQSTGKQFPIVQFSADTDMATEGWVSLTSTESPEIVVTQFSAEEFAAHSRDNTGYLMLERRTNDALKRSNLKCSWLVRVEDSGPTEPGLSFVAADLNLS